MKKLNVKALALAVASTVSMTAYAAVPADHPLAEYLAAPGATLTMPVTQVKEGFDADFIQEAYNSFESFHAQMGGDHTLYYLTNWSTVMRTDMVNPHPQQKMLNRNLQASIGELVVDTDSKGPMALNDYVIDPLFRTQGVMMIHKGEVVYESYPGMSPSDMHIWMSSSKTLTGLVFAMLVEEGKVDVNASVTQYVPALKGTAWDEPTVLNLLNHTAGLDHEETNSSILDPEGVFVRFVGSTVTPTDTSIERPHWLDALRDVQPLEDEQPGARFRYSSLNTHVLGMIIQEVTGKRVSDVFEERIWGQLGARMPLAVHLSQDGAPLNLGIVSSTLEDFAMYATMYTPSWDKVAHEQVVTPSLLQQIRSSGDAEAFVGGAKEGQALAISGTKPVKGGYQFDWFYEDGAMYKHGNTGQGIYIDPERDFAAVYFSAVPYVPPYGEIKVPAYFRAAAEMLSDK
ncbi:serine hydrolase domain-containing protein [Thaumasiovibrio sp. DFM-14]|uniref:serine hydrolase domain-containing protein n=1 Tax=Thaumasiovibrio sp. DFM-14 TaxID=3384792 RepID=UPI0039A06735